MSEEKINMTVTFRVTQAQAVALRAMFEYWNSLATVGGSREVTFYVDGDGSFKPHCQIITDKPEINTGERDKELKKAAIVKDDGGDRTFDFDPVIGLIRKREEEFEKRLRESQSNSKGDETQNESNTERL